MINKRAPNNLFRFTEVEERQVNICENGLRSFSVRALLSVRALHGGHLTDGQKTGTIQKAERECRFWGISPRTCVALAICNSLFREGWP